MNELDDIVKEFLVESHENLDQLDRDLVALETQPTSHEILSRIFRAIHTIKGTTGFLGFAKLESVAHAGESLLSKLRDGVLILNPEITSALLATVDAVREMLANIEATGQDGEGDYTTLIERLTALQAASLTSAPPQPATPLVAAAPPPENPAVPALQAAKPSPKAKAEPVPEVKPIGEILIANGRATPDQVAGAIEQQLDGDPRHVGEILVEQGVVAPGEVLDALKTQNETRASALSASNIRVDVGQLDKLMNLVGELVLARNQILQFSAGQQDPGFLGTSQRLNLITTELQEGVMKTRMQPIDNIWNKFPRVVRDLAMSCGKRVRVEMEGKETELDKTLIEAIKDPLTHIVRNSVDHGIERPEQRVAAGKPAEGRLFLRAYHEGGQVNIEISDDGAGIEADRVKRKALERGLITSEQAARMGEREALNLILLPGLSTAEKITNVSGRGVGMDVVKTNLEKISGTIDIHSQPGQGTTLRIKIPLTLAIIPALIVTSAGDRYAIPQVSLLELVRLEGDEAREGIESIHGAPVYRLRGNLLPLAYLNQELGLETAGASAERDVVNIVVLQADDRQFGLVVDTVNDTEEIVVKPLGKQLKDITAFAGATIMGDGRVALILDVVGLAHQAGVISQARERALAEDRKAQAAAIASESRQTLLLILGHDDGRIAIPLRLVTRLEEFSRSSLEKTGSQEVVQYRGHILPLVRVSSLLQERRRKPRNPPNPAVESDKIQVVVYSDHERTVGLIVDRILDIVEEDLAKQQPASRDGIQGSAVIQGRVTEILDLEQLIRTHAALRVAKKSYAEVRA
jgi:two-component system, chemotaxis family, sensor kinase CheA